MTDTDSRPKAPLPHRASYTLHVASVAGHDREGFESFPAAQLQLVRLLDEVLDLFDTEPRFQHFTLDGSAILLEDYLSVRPEHFERVETAVQEGRLLVGPWYIQTDPLLVSAESLIRNLLIGLRTARVFGPPLLVGYLPEASGLPGYAPQILKSFKIDVAVLRLASQVELVEYDLVGTDGTRLLVSRIPNPKLTTPIRDLRERFAPSFESGQLLFPYPWNVTRSRHERLDFLKSLPETQISLHDDVFHSSPSAYAKALAVYAEAEPMKMIQATHDNLALSLADSWRKLADHINHCDKIEGRLIAEIEPLLAWAEHLTPEGDERFVRRPQALLRKMWQSLLENQNCAIFHVLRAGSSAGAEVSERFRRIEECADSLSEALLPMLAEAHEGQANAERGKTSLLLQLMKVSDPGFRLMAVKLPEEAERRGVIVRGYSAVNIAIHVTLTPWRAFSTVEVVTLDEAPTGGQLAPNPDQNGAITFRAAPYRILTFWFHD